MVIKVGSSLLVDEVNDCVNTDWLNSLLEDVAALRQQHKKVVLVSSGAIAYGKLTLGMTKQQLSLDAQQALAALGQIQLVQHYQVLAKQQGMQVAQVLLNLNDTEDRRRCINLRNTLNKLLEMDIIPIINENDSVATSEIRYGDNDRLAARVAQLVDADTLILLSDIDGFYSDDPRLHPDATLIPSIDAISPEILAMAKNSSSNYGSGGMITKLEAARIAMGSGCRMLITLGKPLHPLRHYVSEQKGTWFKPKDSVKTAKKMWLQNHLKLAGSVVIDAGALKALNEGYSLLSIGITALQGQFSKGSAIKVVTDDETEVARGLVNYSYHDLEQIIGKKSSDIAAILGYEGCHEVVHRENLVLMG